MSIDQNLTHSIVGVVKDEKGEIMAYKLENGEIIMKEQGVTMAKQGNIKGVSVAVSKMGEEFLKSIPDNSKSNNLENLPVIEYKDIM